MSAARSLRVLLIDPSLFTGPYDAALTKGLLSAGVQPTWLVRPTRRGDREEIPARYSEPFFYRRVDDSTWLPHALRPLAKGLSHLLGLMRLGQRVAADPPDVIHFQWTVIPVLDALAMLFLKRFCPVVLTVHDTRPFNGDFVSLGQSWGFDIPIRTASRSIVHTQAGKQSLVSRGLSAEKIAVVPHGPLALRVASPLRRRSRSDARWTFVLFGEIKPYKGVDVLVEALARVPLELRDRMRFVVAGRPRMDCSSWLVRARELGVDKSIELCLRRHSDQEMAELFAEADSFLFPYHQIDASGVYFLVKSLGKWIIASRIGVFAEDIVEGVQGSLVPPRDAAALAAALSDAIGRRPPPCAPVSASWDGIGAATVRLYREA